MMSQARFIAMMAVCAVLARNLPEVAGFVARHPWKESRSSSGLFGINEWRDQVYDFSEASSSVSGAAIREICVLPFPFHDVNLQGEQRQLRLYEDRFIQLFDHAMKENEGVLAMGLIASSGIIQTVPLCEIEAYNRIDGFGIFVTIRVVGRAQLVELTQQDPYIRASCVELCDEIPANLELSNLMASNIENFMLLLSSMEHRLADAMKDRDDVAESDKEEQRRLTLARLEDRFYDDDEDPEEDEGEDISDLDRSGRFRKACSVALATDTQGYCVTKSTNQERSPQELTAISWAAFCTDILSEEDATHRIQALSCESLFDRLKLASHMLREKKNNLKQAMEKAGLNVKGEDFDEGF